MTTCDLNITVDNNLMHTHCLVPRPHLWFEAQLVAGKFHELRPIKCMEQPSPPSDLSRTYSGKQKHDALMRYPQRIRRLNIFPASKMEVIIRFVISVHLDRTYVVLVEVN